MFVAHSKRRGEKPKQPQSLNDCPIMLNAEAFHIGRLIASACRPEVADLMGALELAELKQRYRSLFDRLLDL